MVASENPRPLTRRVRRLEMLLTALVMSMDGDDEDEGLWFEFSHALRRGRDDDLGDRNIEYLVDRMFRNRPARSTPCHDTVLRSSRRDDGPRSVRLKLASEAAYLRSESLATRRIARTSREPNFRPPSRLFRTQTTSRVLEWP